MRHIWVLVCEILFKLVYVHKEWCLYYSVCTNSRVMILCHCCFCRCCYFNHLYWNKRDKIEPISQYWFVRCCCFHINPIRNLIVMFLKGTTHFAPDFLGTLDILSVITQKCKTSNFKWFFPLFFMFIYDCVTCEEYKYFNNKITMAEVNVNNTDWKCLRSCHMLLIISCLSQI